MNIGTTQSGKNWRKCKYLSAGDKRSVTIVTKLLNSPYYVSHQAVNQMVGLVQMLAAKVAELEAKQ